MGREAEHDHVVQAAIMPLKSASEFPESANVFAPGTYRRQCCRVCSEVAPLAILVRGHGQVRPRHGRQHVHKRSTQHGACDRFRPPTNRRPRRLGCRCNSGEKQDNAAHLLRSTTHDRAMTSPRRFRRSEAPKASSQSSRLLITVCRNCHSTTGRKTSTTCLGSNTFAGGWQWGEPPR